MNSKTNKSGKGIMKSRLLSLDALRGFDMLWIIGGGALITQLAEVSSAGWLKALAVQMTHVRWEGFHFYDLIFPLFMFIAGIAIPLSVMSAKSRNIPRKKLAIKALRRMLILILLGILYNGVFRDGFQNARYASVLGQIGIAYFFASLIIIFSDSLKTSLYWLAGILAGVSVIQLFVPVPGFGAGVFTPEGCINGYIDRLYLPGRLAYGPEGMLGPGEHGIYDALGLLSIVSAIGITIMGTVAGRIVQSTRLTEYRKTGILAVTGLVLIVCGLALSCLSVIKVCWTTSYNFLAGGISFMLFALLSYNRCMAFTKWSFFFRVIGMNSIFIYLLVKLFPWERWQDMFSAG